jgi:hypothetical protein
VYWTSSLRKKIHGFCEPTCDFGNASKVSWAFGSPMLEGPRLLAGRRRLSASRPPIDDSRRLSRVRVQKRVYICRHVRGPVLRRPLDLLESAASKDFE